MQQNTPAPTRILRDSEVSKRVPVHKVTRYRWEQKGLFPRRVRLGPNSVGWYEHEVEAWLASRSTDTLSATGTTEPAR